LVKNYLSRLKDWSPFDCLVARVDRLAVPGAEHRFFMKRVIFLLICSVALAGFSLQMQRLAEQPTGLRELSSAGLSQEAEFLVVGVPKRSEYFGKVNQTANAHVAVDGKSAPIEVRYSGQTKLESGAVYRARLKFGEAKVFQKHSFEASVIGEPLLIRSPESSLFEKVRSAFVQATSAIDLESKALVLGLAIGDESLVTEALSEDMKTVSLTHLMAVSGANCAIVAGVVLFLLSKLPIGRVVRATAATVAIASYVALVGLEPSVIRAGFMSVTVILALAAGRKPNPTAALGFAVLCLLVFDPWLSVNYGFLLSVLATAGILVLTPALYHRLKNRLPKALALAFSVSAGAQVFCLPVLLQLQPGISTYSLLANVLAEPLVAPVTILGILACSVAWLFPWMSLALTFLASLGTWCIAQLAHFFAGLPMNTLNWLSGPAAVAGAVVLAISLVTALKTQLKWPRLLAGGVVVSFLASTLLAQVPIQKIMGDWPPKDWQVVQCDVGQGDALVLRSAGQIALVDVGRDSNLIDSCLSQLGINQIDLLVLTHFDLDHVGGLGGVLKGRKTLKALISPFDDPRWAANNTLRDLTKQGTAVVVADEGTTGIFGGAKWRVVGPAVSASLIEDSNDGSLVISWNFENFSLLTMADAGEHSQQLIASKSLSWMSRLSDDKPMILKVAHHGSADQYPELIEELAPQVSLISVGASNTYGHPTQRTLKLLQGIGSKVFRTDQSGSIALSFGDSGFQYSTSGQG
jgi:competence protein ComEC